MDDCANNLAAMSVAVGAAVFTKLNERDAGRSRVDGVLFGSKGTSAAALGLFQYFLKSGTLRQSVNMIGMGTDLQFAYTFIVVLNNPDIFTTVALQLANRNCCNSLHLS